MFKLVIQDDEGKTTVVPLIRDEITIGRKEGNTIRLTERNVSRRHARILRSENDVQIEDLGSYNGIRVNNARIAERVSLRISDQVQIGDYKLYLKAEGAEASDDGRTIPIERLDTPPAAIAVVASPTQMQAQLPTTQMPSLRPQAAPGPMAVADTDPAGRPVATASQVAAMSAPAAYGKLVIISSNMAGKELLLTRPQMDVGRANADLIIDHRSISRRHARLTRDPETQRYTISDLSSANGVKVNGQGYGKVELRRGDMVDLGHVKLRFVEPGEDFTFTRDMVVNTGEDRKSGPLLAIVLGVAVLGVVVVVFAMKGGGGGQASTPPKGGSAAVVTPVGSGQAVAPAVADAGVTGISIGSNDSPELKRLESDCYSDITDRKWSDLETCADQVDGIKKGGGQQYRDRAKAEIPAEADFDHMQSSLKDRDLKSAQKSFDKIPDDSVYKEDAKKQLGERKAALIGEGISKARGYAQRHKCDELDRFVQQESSALGEDVGTQIAQSVKCEAGSTNPNTQVATAPDCSSAMVAPRDAHCKAQFCGSHPSAAACASASTSCDHDALIKDGTGAMGTGDNSGALKKFESAYNCAPDTHTLQLAFMASCNSNNIQRARYWWKRMNSEEQNRNVIMCVRRQITRDQLDGS